MLICSPMLATASKMAADRKFGKMVTMSIGSQSLISLSFKVTLTKLRLEYSSRVTILGVTRDA